MMRIFLRITAPKKSDPTANLVDDQKSPQLNFGPYAGLINAFNFGGTILLELKPGDNRIFTLLGFNDKDSCSDIFTALRDKSKLSKAYRLGTTAPMTLAPGVPAEAEIITPSEVDPNDYFSDCVIPDPETIYPLYKFVNLEKPGFPYGTFRAFTTPPPTNDDFYCEFVDISLKAIDVYDLARRTVIPGTVAQDTYFELNYNSVSKTISTYDTEQHCSLDTSDDQNAELAFKFEKNQTSQRRWFRQRRDINTFGTNFAMGIAEYYGPVITPITKNLVLFRERPVGGLFIDSVMPHLMEQNVCYQVTSFLRDLSGNVYPNSNISTLSLNNSDSPTNLNATFYLNNSDCENSQNATNTIQFPLNSHSASYFVKMVNSGALNWDYTVVPSDASVAKTVNPNLSLVTVSSTTVVDDFLTLRITSTAGIQNNNGITCVPLFVSPVRSDGTEFIYSSTPARSLLPLKVQVADETGPNTNGYSLFSDDACTVPVDPIASSNTPAGTDVAAPGPGISFYKIFVKPDNTATYGRRKLEFYYNSNLVGTHHFDLTDPSH